MRSIAHWAEHGDVRGRLMLFTLLIIRRTVGSPTEYYTVCKSELAYYIDRFAIVSLK